MREREREREICSDIYKRNTNSSLHSCPKPFQIAYTCLCMILLFSAISSLVITAIQGSDVAEFDFFYEDEIA